jgi:CarD family transcriptional regulator
MASKAGSRPLATAKGAAKKLRVSAKSVSKQAEKKPAVKLSMAKKSVMKKAAAAVPKATTKAPGKVAPVAKPPSGGLPFRNAQQRPSGTVSAGRQASPTARTMPAAVEKAGGKITAPHMAPVPPVAKAPPAAPQPTGAKKPVHQRHGFKVNEWIVYPAHGVGRIVGIEEQEIAGLSLELFVITFEKDKMTLRVPTGKSQSVGMRKLAEEDSVKRAMETLKGKARIKRTMWSRRAQEYEAKINSGDLISIAEVVRDLYRSESQPEQSYSERQLYEAALDRMAREIAAVDKLDERGAVQRITDVLAKSAKGRRIAAEEAEVKAA